MSYLEDGNDAKEGLFEHTRFLGIRNNIGSEGFDLGDLETGLNQDIDDALEISRRKGFSAPVVAGVDRSLWARGGVCLGVGSNALKLINRDFSTATLRTGLTANRELSYDVMGDRVFYANGAEMGVVQNGQHRTWGLTPPTLPLATATGGTLLAGNYQFVATYVRNDGQESGAGRAGVITLAGLGVDGGIALSAIPVSTDPTVVAKNIYVTPVNGDALYLRGTIPNATTTFTVNALQRDANELLTQFMTPPPAFDYLGVFKGWMLGSKDNRLYPSEPYAPELFDLRKSIPMLDRITMVAPLNNNTDGVYIGTASQVIWMDGDAPETWRFKVAADYGVIPGTLAYSDGETLGDGSGTGDQIAYFATARGLCVGQTGGKFTNLTEKRFAYPSMDRGAGIVRRHRGMIQYVATLEGIETAGNVTA